MSDVDEEEFMCDDDEEYDLVCGSWHALC